MPRVAILDYGSGNLRSAERAVHRAGADVEVTADPHTAEAADGLVVPGVGAFAACMEGLLSVRGEKIIGTRLAGGRPVLGICVGMQILFEASEEFGEHAGLGILPGRVKPIPSLTVDHVPQRVPHIGWNHLVEPEQGRDWAGTLLAPLKGRRPAVYFVHSFAAQPADPADRLADCVYGGHRICAAVQRGNVMATQFHPERSGETGLDVVRHFVAM